MKNKLLNLLAFVGVGTMILLTGCGTTRDVRHAQDTAIVDSSPSATSKGHVEFYTLKHNYPVPIYLVDQRGKALLLGSVGVKAGDRYSVERNGEVVAQKLRVAIPPGTYTFMVENHGQRIEVPVTAGQLTPVEVDYAAFDTATRYVVYRLDTRVFPVTTYKEPAKSSSVPTAGPVYASKPQQATN
jgi:hypothetical protein